MLTNDETTIQMICDILEQLLKQIKENPTFLSDFLEETRSPVQNPKGHWTATQNMPLHNNTIRKKLVPIEKAVEFLDQHFKNIPSIEIWSESMGYSYNIFWEKFTSHFHDQPKNVFIQKKKSVLVEFFSQNPSCTATRAARKIHLQGGNGLWQFVKREFNCTPTELRQSISDGRK